MFFQNVGRLRYNFLPVEVVQSTDTVTHQVKRSKDYEKDCQHPKKTQPAPERTTGVLAHRIERDLYWTISIKLKPCFFEEVAIILPQSQPAVHYQYA